MKNALPPLFEKLFAPLLLVALTPVAAALGAKILTGNWTLWFREHSIWTTSGVVCVLLAATVLYIRRKPAAPAGYSILLGMGGGSNWRKIGEIEHAGVVWVVEAPDVWHKYELPDRLDVALPPRCPTCKTELEENKRWSGSHVWTCIRCGFKKNNKDSYYSEQERARKVAKVTLEEHLATQPD